MNGLTAKGNTMKKSHLHLIKWAISKGYTLEVWGDGENPDYTGTSYEEAKENTEALIKALKRGETTANILLKDDGRPVAWFYIVNGLEPEELVSHYSVDGVGEAWQKAYDTECYGELCKENK